MTILMTIPKWPYHQFHILTNITANLNSDIEELNIAELKKVPIVLNSLKNIVDKLDTDKLKNVFVDLKKSSYTVHKEVVEKDVYDELVENIISNNTNERVKKRGHKAKIKDTEDKIPKINDLAEKQIMMLGLKILKIKCPILLI